MRLLRPIVLATTLSALLLACAVIALRPRDTHGSVRPPRTNAIWIGHSWVATPPTLSALQGLCTLLHAHNLSEIYVHVGPLDGAGRIPEGRAPSAARFTAGFHAVCPGVRALAWIGQLLPKWDGLFNLHDEGERAALVRTAVQFTAEGFDGVQYDLEPVADGDAAFLDLLRRTRAAIGSGRWLAVAGPALLPTSGLPALPHLRLPLIPWSSGYYLEVAALTNETDPMLYDTSLRDPAAYSAFVAEQARDLTLALPGVSLRFGLPAFPGRSAVFDDRVENLSTGLAGVRQGLPNGGGVALYALWTMTPAHWSVFGEYSGAAGAGAF
ncbi:MAG TPA: hypothetical protein VNL71_05300 [Chloroflexota bacterium]|nr:hypothetical protein [Chloroflexota bacterium]